MDYTPSKRTALALAIALELSLDETKDLLERAGLALSPSLMSLAVRPHFDVGRQEVWELESGQVRITVLAER